MEEKVTLTAYSHSSGCGCKIAPKVLDEILQSSIQTAASPQLLVGNNTKDDAAVYDLGNGTALISTTDFFMPIVDDAFSFGKIAAANSISDIYAMGGKPVLAIAVLGWPVDKLPAALAQQVLEGGRTICAEAGIPLAGGHSIDSPEPFFGLAVNGLVLTDNIKRNNSAQVGDLLLLTKPLGVGILSAAQKRGLLQEEHQDAWMAQLTQLNRIGEALGKIKGVHAVTDITGFGLLGHLIEVCEGSGVSAELYYSRIPVLEGAREYLKNRVVPDATYKNWNACSEKTGFEKGVNVMEAFSLLPDPQTNGGLLLSVAADAMDTVTALFREYKLDAFCEPVGRITAAGEKMVRVIP